jgi:hypothetical protein
MCSTRCSSKAAIVKNGLLSSADRMIGLSPRDSLNRYGCIEKSFHPFGSADELTRRLLTRRSHFSAFSRASLVHVALLDSA